MPHDLPLPVLIDCDPGVDDAIALLVAAASPRIELRAVTCVAGNRPLEQTAPNARRVLDLAGAQHVPVLAGCARPLAWREARCNLVHGADGLGGVALPPAAAIDPRHAVDLIVEQLQALPPGTLHLVALGPLTNLALAELRAPGLLRRAARIDIMGGAAFQAGNVTPHAEFNFHCDPLAAQVVLAAGAAVQVFGLDVTSQAVMSPAWHARLGMLPGAVAAAAHRMLQGYVDNDPLLHDPCPVAALIDPTLFGGELRRVRVEWRDAATEGRLIAEPPGTAGDGHEWGLARVITQVDNPRLLQLVHDCIAALPRP